MRPKHATRYMSVNHPKVRALETCPNAGPNPSVWGMKKHYWGMNAKCVKSGQYVYDVSSRPDLYEAAQ